MIFFSRRFFTCFFVLLFCMGLSLQCVAQKQWEPRVEYSEKHYTLSDGLVQMQVMSLYQDSRRYLWCGTKDGVSRFDGRSFKNYSAKKLKAIGSIFKIAEDKQHNMLFFHSDGVSKMLEDTVILYPYVRKYKDFNKFDFENYFSILQLQNKEGKQERQLFQFTDSCFRELKLPIKYRYYSEVKGKNLYFQILASKPSKKPMLWVIDKQNIYTYDIEKGRGLDTINCEHYIQKLVCGAHENLYGVGPAGIYKFDGTHFQLEYSYALPKSGLQQVTLSPDQHSLVIAYLDAIYRYKDEKMKLIKDGLNFVRCFLFDDEGNLWVGTEEGLINFFHLNFQNYTFAKDKKDYVWNILEDNECNMWFSSFTNGIWKWDGKMVKDCTSILNKEIRKHLKKTAAYRYRYYMGGAKKGKTLYFPTNINVLKYNENSFAAVKGLPKDEYLCSYISKEHLLFGGVYGVYKVSEGKRVKHWKRSQLNISTCVTLCEDRKGTIIAGSWRGTAIIKKDTIIHSKTPSVSSARDHKGNVWLFADRISLYEGDTIRQLYEFENETFSDLYFIKPNYLFAGGKLGLYLIDLAEYYEKGRLSFTKYTKSSGFLGNECGQNSMFQDSKGDLWIATSDKTVKFNPQELINRSQKAPKPVLKVLKTNDLTQPWEKVDSKETLRLPYKSNNVGFVFSAIAFEQTDVRYFYKLGEESEWSPPTKDNEVKFYNLHAGTYNFMLKADGGCSQHSSEIVSYKFTITRPFWMTWWFWFLTLLIIGSIAFLVLRYYKRRIVRKEIFKQQQIHKVTNLQLSNIKSQLNPHFIFNLMNHFALSSLKGNGKDVYNQFVDLSNLIREALTEAEEPVKMLSAELSFIERYLQLQKYRFGERFYFSFKIDDEIDKQMFIPRMSLQILVENAIKHGLEQSKRVGDLQIIGMKKENAIVLGVKDNGKGFSERNSKEGTGKGLSNLRKILEIYNVHNKEEAKLQITSSEKGSTVLIHIPSKYKFKFKKNKNEEGSEEE